MKILLEHERAILMQGDSKNIGDLLPENSVDSIVCDPPAGISFMGRGWDDDKGGRDEWSAWLADLLGASYRALKPGGHILAWAIPRTSHWTARALELAGFEIRDVHHDIISIEPAIEAFVDSLDTVQRVALARILESQTSPIVYQAFGTGFPKSLNISKAIDAAAGAERPVIGKHPNPGSTLGRLAMGDGWQAAPDLTAPATPEAQKWDGFGTALKPAVEHWILARKSLDGTYASNVLIHGTGALNIDACRIGSDGGTSKAEISLETYDTVNAYGNGLNSVERGLPVDGLGRWPAHLSLGHAPGCRVVGQREDSHVKRVGENIGADSRELAFGMGRQATTTTTTTHDVYRCAEGCPVRQLDEQSGTETGSNGGDINAAGLGYKAGAKGASRKVGKDKGGASRFFYVAKPARSEKDAGLEHLPKRSAGEATGGREEGSAGLKSPRAGAGRTGGAANVHPTCKSIALMKWLIQLITPPGGTVLDPFSGSGTTGVAALELGMSFIGSELGGDDDDPYKYLPILVGRIRHALGLEPEPVEVTLAKVAG